MSAHAEFLRAASQDVSLATQIKSDFRKAKISDQDMRMLEFVEKLTKFPWLLVETDVRQLREAGFKDVEILHIVLGSAHFNYLNRMADGIGIQFEYKTDIPEFKVPQNSQSNTEGSARPLSVSWRLRPTQAQQLVSTAKATRKTIAWIDFPNQKEDLSSADGPQNFYRVMAENPEAQKLAKEWLNYSLTATLHLDARQRARLALFISGLNRCDYSVYWYQQVLSHMGEDQTLLDRLAEGKTPENLSSLDQRLFQHALRLTQEPWTTKEVHIQELRQAGLDDKAILQLTILASYLSFENRVALGLGIGLESH